ncbi:hypothetical protein DPMN_027112 [Dreissena polymorpha]|uniref:Uncharacterized protein n=1 Tax=Dreissena polymorpha TaxID=45954 RepID=A0A9D4LSW5_DREPO|nr:hypothetical protein DPMN_027112 [Dreissena polymorpha]
MEFIKALLRKDKADNAYRFPERNCLSPVITTSTTTTITTTTTPTPVNTPSLWEMLLKILQSELDTRTSTTTTIAPTTTTTIPTTTEMPIWKLLLEKLQGILPTTATSITVTGGTIAQVSPTQTLSATTPSLGYDQSTAFIYLETTNTSEFDNLTFENKTEASATFDNITEFSLNGHHTPISFEAMSVTPANGVPDLLSTVSQLTNNSDAYTVTITNNVPDQTVATETMSVTENSIQLNANILDSTTINHSSAENVTEVLNTITEINDLKTNISSEGANVNVTYISDTVLYGNASTNSTENVFSTLNVINGTNATELGNLRSNAEYGELEMNTTIINLTDSMSETFPFTPGIENTTVDNRSAEPVLMTRNASFFETETENATIYNQWIEINATGATGVINNHSFNLNGVMDSSDISLNASDTLETFISYTSLSNNTFLNTTDNLFWNETTSDLTTSDRPTDTENSTSSYDLATNLTNGAQETINEVENSTSMNSMATNLTTVAQETKNETQKQNEILPIFTFMQQKVLADMIKAIEKELASRKGEQEDKANKSSSEQVTTDNFLSITQTMTENKRHINYEMSTPSTLFEGTTSVVDNIYSTLETPVNTHRQMQEQEVTNVVNSYSGATQVPNPIARSATVPIPFDKMFGLFPNTGQDRSNLPTTKAYDWSITTPINTTPPPPASTQLPNMIVQLMERIGYTPMAPTAQSDVIGSEQSEIESLLQIMNSDPQSRRRQAVYGLLSSKESNQNGNRDVNLNSFKSKSSGYTTITTNPIVFGKGSKEIVNNRTPSSTVTSDRNDTIKSVLRDFHPQPEEMTSAIYLTEDVTSAILVTEGVTSATELTAEIQSTIKNESTKTLESMPSAISNQSVWQQNNKESSTEIHLGFVTSSIGKAKQRVQSISTSRPEEATKAVTMETTYDMKAQGRAIATTPSSLSGTNVNQRSSEKPSTRLRNNQVNYKRYS